MNHPPVKYALLDQSNGDLYPLAGARDFGDAYLACTDAYSGNMDSELFRGMICLPHPGARLRPVVWRNEDEEEAAAQPKRCLEPDKGLWEGIRNAVGISVGLAGTAWLCWWLVQELLASL